MDHDTKKGNGRTYWSSMVEAKALGAARESIGILEKKTQVGAFVEGVKWLAQQLIVDAEITHSDPFNGSDC